MLTLRPYQTEAVEAMLTSDGAPLCVLPTGTGKSIVIAELINQISGRVLVLAHVKELVEQNSEEFLGLCPEADVGIHSAGLGKRDTDNAVIFGGVQSVVKKLQLFPKFDAVIIDEAHLIPHSGDGRYRQTLDALSDKNPNIKILGLTATPFRTDSGSLVDGDGAIFSHIAFEAPFWYFVDNGWLSRMTTRQTATMDLSKLKKRGGEYTEQSMQVEAAKLTEKVLTDAERALKTRKKALVFCSSIKHAEETTENLRAEGFSAELITGKTSTWDRDATVEKFRRGDFQVLVNVNVLTTGFNVPDVDLLILWRATTSPGLYVQMVGRGSRVAPGKKDCLVLDYGGNIYAHGPVDAVEVTKVNRSKADDQDEKVKPCPQCESLIHPNFRTCPHCGWDFTPAEQDEEVDPFSSRTRRKASDMSILTKRGDNGARIHDVTRVEYSWHTKTGKPKSIRVTYYSGFVKVASEWLCPFHSPYMKRRFDVWVKRRQSRPTPFSLNQNSTESQLQAVMWTLKKPEMIHVRKNGKYYEVVGYDFDDKKEATA